VRKSMTLALLLTSTFAFSNSPTTLKRHDGPAPKETCEQHVQLTRHTYLDAAKAAGDGPYAKSLRKSYKELGDDRRVALMCTIPKYRETYDLDLSVVELQRRYTLAPPAIKQSKPASEYLN
jgi:hypothetical protein